MIETIYPAKETEAMFTGRSRKLPRNIRTCGKSGSPFPVYIEDYVETYLHHLSEAEFPECCVSILVGRVMETEEGRGLFVRGAIYIRQIWQEGQYCFDEGIWNEVYEKIRLYFPEDEVAGWCIAGPGFRIQEEEPILRVHLDNFADSERILMTYESLEKEEAIRICKDRGFFILPGYSIYYEKNDEMQNYMLDHKLRITAFSNQETVQKKTEKETETIVEGEESKYAANKSQTKKDRKNSYRDVLQLGAIAGVIILIITILIGVDLLSGISESESTGGQSAQLNEGSEGQENVSSERLAFEDFSFLRDKEIQEREGEQTGEDSQSESTAEFSMDSEKTGVAAGQTGEDSQKENNIESSLESGKTEVAAGQTGEDSQNENNTESSVESRQSGVAAGQTGEDSRKENNTESSVERGKSGVAAGQTGENSQGESATEPSEKDENLEGDNLSNRIEEPVEEVLSRNEYHIYYVKAGDTLASICIQHYGTVELVKYISEVNQVVDINQIYIGQELILPKK